MSDQDKKKRAEAHFRSLVILLVVGGALATSILLAWYWEPTPAWLVSMGLLLLAMLVIGFVLKKLPLGLLIDKRNFVSLSRFQIIVWTVIILPALLVVAVQNVESDEDEPLALKIPDEILFVLGISGTALVGAPLARSTKTKKTGDLDEANATFQALGVLNSGQKAQKFDRVHLKDLQGRLIAVGQIVHKRNPEDANLSDMFMGEETSNAAYVDLGKIQQFYVTIILAVAYAVTLGRMLDDGAPYEGLSALDEGMVALLGISHGAYLSSKAIPRS